MAKTAVDMRWPNAGDSAQAVSGVILVLIIPTEEVSQFWGWDGIHVYDDNAEIAIPCELTRHYAEGVTTLSKASCVTMEVYGQDHGWYIQDVPFPVRYMCHDRHRS
jgi:hypothetical protein